MSAGTRRRDDGLHQLALAAEYDDWPERAALAIEDFARRGIPFTAEDIRLCVDDPARPGLIGAAFNAAARRGLIECVGFRAADRPSRRAGLVRVWRSP